MSWTRSALRVHRLLAVLALPLLAGCSSLRFAADWDRGVDHRAYRTFTFAPTPPLERTGPEASNTAFLDRRIRRAVVAALGDSKKGLQPAEPGTTADLLVVYRLNLKDVINVYGYGYYGGTSSSSFREGTLVIDLIDRKRDEVVWRGWAEGIRTQVQHSEEQIFGIVRTIFRGYPPKK